MLCSNSSLAYATLNFYYILFTISSNHDHRSLHGKHVLRSLSGSSRFTLRCSFFLSLSPPRNPRRRSSFVALLPRSAPPLSSQISESVHQKGFGAFSSRRILDSAVRVFAASNGIEQQEPIGGPSPLGNPGMASPLANQPSLLRRPSLPQKGKEMRLETMQVAKVYRQLLKAVGKHIGKDGDKRHFRDYIIEEFRKNVNVSDQAAVQNKVKLARDYTFLLNSVHHHKELLLSYNIAVDRSDEMKKILNKSAASVGLQLPDVYQA